MIEMFFSKAAQKRAAFLFVAKHLN